MLIRCIYTNGVRPLIYEEAVSAASCTYEAMTKDEKTTLLITLDRTTYVVSDLNQIVAKRVSRGEFAIVSVRDGASDLSGCLEGGA